MAGSLSAQQVAAYERDGILFPIRVMGEDQAAQAVRDLEALEARWDGRIPKRRNQKLHMLAPWLNEIVRSPAVLDAVESLIGPGLGSRKRLNDRHQQAINERRLCADSSRPRRVSRRPSRAQPSRRNAGNNNTSRMLDESVKSMTSRSRPMPQPAVGGIPYSSARMKSAS